jgi:hypothetical protein
LKSPRCEVIRGPSCKPSTALFSRAVRPLPTLEPRTNTVLYSQSDETLHCSTYLADVPGHAAVASHATASRRKDRTSMFCSFRRRETTGINTRHARHSAQHPSTTWKTPRPQCTSASHQTPTTQLTPRAPPSWHTASSPRRPSGATCSRRRR